jgi:hypothetical protein
VVHVVVVQEWNEVEGLAQRDSFRSRSVWAHTGQTTLTWQWRPDDNAASRTSYVGDITWPNSADAAENQAAALLDIAEDGFVERCPPVRNPAASVSASASTDAVNVNDVSADQVVDLERALQRASKLWNKMAVCSVSLRDKMPDKMR